MRLRSGTSSHRRRGTPSYRFKLFGGKLLSMFVCVCVYVSKCMYVYHRSWTLWIPKLLIRAAFAVHIWPSAETSLVYLLFSGLFTISFSICTRIYMHILEQYVTMVLQLVLGCDYIKMCVFIYKRHTHLHTSCMYICRCTRLYIGMYVCTMYVQRSLHHCVQLTQVQNKFCCASMRMNSPCAEISFGPAQWDCDN